jgi:dTDP-D-glucose 4,6-dehydratase
MLKQYKEIIHIYNMTREYLLKKRVELRDKIQRLCGLKFDLELKKRRENLIEWYFNNEEWLDDIETKEQKEEREVLFYLDRGMEIVLI